MGFEKQRGIEGEGRSPRDTDRERMRPADYLQKYTERLSEASRTEVYKRKIQVVNAICKAIGGRFSLSNEQLDVIIGGEVPLETMKNWESEARINKKDSQINLTTNSPKPGFAGNYNAGKVSEIMDRKSDED